MPLDAISAELWCPGQNFQFFTGINLRISITRFSTNCLNSFDTPLIQLNATIEFSQQCTESILTILANADLIDSTSFARVNADESSNRGMVCAVVGATLVLEARSLL